jgi:ATP-dependent DNA helicase DinG
MPAFKAREGQQSLAASVARAIAQRSSLVAEAGTGTGKTFAYLVPLLLSGARAMISTGTRPLQDQLFHRDLPSVKAALGLGTRIALLKGRANYVCHHHLDQQMADGRFADPQMPGKLRKIRQFAQISLSGDRADCTALAEDDPVWVHATSTRDNCLGQECPEFKRCFVFQARREAMAADVVVVNHHLFCADLALRESSMAELLPTVDAVIFDEAHQLPEAATEFFGDGCRCARAYEKIGHNVAFARGRFDNPADKRLGLLGWIAQIFRAACGQPQRRNVPNIGNFFRL